jgi:signal transduction histidine kinase
MDDLVLALCQGADGSVWVGLDFDGGIRRVKDGHITFLTWRQGLPHVAVKVLHEDREGRLWIGTGGGLYSRAAGKIVNHGAKNNILSSVIYAICEDAQGAIWVGTAGGLGRWTGGDFTAFSSECHAPHGSVDSLLADEEGNLWIGTPREGIFRYRDGKFFAYTQKEGLPGNEIFELLDDGAGSLWMSTDEGIFRVLKKDLDALDHNPQRPLVAIAYRRSDGLRSMVGSNVAKPAAWKTRDGRLLFATTKGLAVIDPKLAEINRTVPPVYIEEVKADSKPMPIGRRALQGESAFRFPPGRGELEFSFAALSFTNPDKCRFRYKLEGVDAAWSAPDTKRTAKYNNLYPGHYRFLVVGCNGDGVWNETGASVAFYLQPHFWQTWWFQGLAVTGVVGVVGTIARFIIVQKMRQKLALLEMQHSLEKERARISRDIHDDLGATLTQITLLSELAQRKANDPPKVSLYTAQISQTARELVQAMDEIVWAVNPRNDRLPMVTGYIFQHAEKFFAGTPVHCRFDSPEELPDHALSAEVRHHLFLAAKEALNNVARHSGATEVWVRWKLVDGELQLCIEDNGKGFTARPGAQFGNGMVNMKKRMEEIGGGFEATSIVGAGTTVRLTLQLKG